MTTKRHAATLIEFVARTALSKTLFVSVTKIWSDVPVALRGKLEASGSERDIMVEGGVRDCEVAIASEYCSLE